MTPQDAIGYAFALLLSAVGVSAWILLLIALCDGYKSWKEDRK